MSADADLARTDVLVVGGGLAGWRAAEAAVRAGVSVTLVANGVGNSPDVHALNCPVRPEDSVAQYVADTLASGRGANDRALVEAMCRGACALTDEIAFDRDASGVYCTIRPLGSSVPRCVTVGHAVGAVVLAQIQARLKGRVAVVRRTLDAAGLVAARAANPRLAIVLATGGWCGKYAFSTNPPYLRGDGLAMAAALGAAVRDVDEAHVQYEPTVRTDGPRRGVPVITTLLYEGARLLTAAGADVLPDARRNKDELARAIFAAGGTAIYDLTDVPEARLLDCKMDPAERRIRVAPAPHSSLGGVVIDAQGRALDGAGRPVPGLFAAGEVTAGVHGLNRLGGNGGTAALVFGTVAGARAAAFAARRV